MKKQTTVLVCVTPQAASSQLVEAGRILAEKNDAALEVISVLPISTSFSKNEPATLEKLFSLAKDAGGEMAIYFSDDPVLTVAAHMAKQKPALIVTGFPGEDSPVKTGPDDQVIILHERISSQLPKHRNCSILCK